MSICATNRTTCEFGSKSWRYQKYGSIRIWELTSRSIERNGYAKIRAAYQIISYCCTRSMLPMHIIRSFSHPLHAGWFASSHLQGSAAMQLSRYSLVAWVVSTLHCRVRGCGQYETKINSPFGSDRLNSDRMPFAISKAFTSCSSTGR